MCICLMQKQQNPHNSSLAWSHMPDTSMDFCTFFHCPLERPFIAVPGYFACCNHYFCQYSEDFSQIIYSISSELIFSTFLNNRKYNGKKMHADTMIEACGVEPTVRRRHKIPRSVHGLLLSTPIKIPKTRKILEVKETRAILSTITEAKRKSVLSQSRICVFFKHKKFIIL